MADRIIRIATAIAFVGVIGCAGFAVVAMVTS